MKRLGMSIFFLLTVIAGLSAQQGDKRVSLKEIVDGGFRQVTAIGEMRSLPDGEHYTAMNPERTMIVRYSYKTGAPVDTRLPRR